MSDLIRSKPVRGNQAEQALSTVLTLVQATASALGTVSLAPPATNHYTEIRFKLLGLGAETVLLTGSVDGTNYETVNLKPFTVADLLIPAATALTNGEYVVPLEWPYQKYKFVKSNVTANTALAFVATSIPKN